MLQGVEHPLDQIRLDDGDNLFHAAQSTESPPRREPSLAGGGKMPIIDAVGKSPQVSSDLSTRRGSDGQTFLLPTAGNPQLL